MERSDEARFSKKKCWGPNFGKKGPKWAKNEVFRFFLDKKSLEFASKVLHMVTESDGGGSGQSPEKK